MSWQTALLVTSILTLASISSALFYCDMKTREFDEDDKDEE